MGRRVESFEELEVYKAAFALQQRIWERSRGWPREETYSLTDQIRRASRSIGANLSEAWAKRRYEAHFVSKLTDADGELNETRHWLTTAHACRYLEASVLAELRSDCDAVGARIGRMILDAGSWTR